MKAFITGMSGFVGGYLAEHLLASGDEVLGSSRSAKWPLWASDDLRRGAAIIRWDIGRPEPLAAETLDQVATFQPDCIYHLAALSVPSDCGTVEPTQRAWEVNVGGTRRVLELAASLDPRPRVLFTSTSHVYGHASRQHHRFDEQAPTAPHRAYGKTKLSAEQEVRSAAKRGLDTLITRSFQHTGPRQEPRLMLPEWAAQFAQADEGPVRVKHLDTWIDLTDVRDVVRAYRLLCQHGEHGGVYNVGSGVARRTGDILALLARLSGRNREIIELAPGDECWDPIAEIGRLTAATGWRPEVPLEQTVADTLADWGRRAGMTDEG